MIYSAWTDGACSGNPGPGGWGMVLIGPDGERVERYGHLPSTTSIRAELQGILEAMRAAPYGATLTVYTDSQFSANALAGKCRLHKNPDLFQAIAGEITDRRLIASVRWIRGHNGDPLNKLADKLAHRGLKAGRKVAA